MTDRITALRALERAVEAGAISTELISEAFPAMWDSVHVLAAFDGNLDGAKTLHVAVLGDGQYRRRDITPAFGLVAKPLSGT